MPQFLSNVVQTDGSLEVLARVDATKGFRHGSPTAPSWTTGTGTPEGVVAAPVGSMYSRLDGSTDTALYRKETGVDTTGWVASENSSEIGGTNWERFFSVTPGVTVDPGETATVDVITFTAGTTGQMIVDMVLQLDWMAGGTQLTAVDMGPSTPAPTNYPGPGIIENGGITLLPITGMWDHVTTGQTVTLRIAVEVDNGISPIKVGECYGTYRIGGAIGGGAYLPSGGTAGQLLTKTSATDYDATWKTVTSLPTGGATGQVLAKSSAANYDATWQSLVSGVSSVDGRTGALVLTDKYLQLTGGTMADAANVSLGTSTGTKIGTATNQKLGFWNGTPVAQNAGWTVTGGYAGDKTFNPESTTLTEVARVLGTLIDAFKSYGLLGPP